MDQLVAMRVFVRIADRLSFAQAADDLDISRAAASGHVAALEKHLGVRLFNRTTRKVSLTAEGAEFLKRSRRMLDELRDAEETLRGSRLKPQGRLCVDVPVAFGRYLLLPALPEFSRRYPAIEIDVRLNDRVVDLVAERVDVALRGGADTAVGSRRPAHQPAQHRHCRLAEVSRGAWRAAHTGRPARASIARHGARERRHARVALSAAVHLTTSQAAFRRRRSTRSKGHSSWPRPDSASLDPPTCSPRTTSPVANSG